MPSAVLPFDRIANWPSTTGMHCSRCDDEGLIDVPLPPWPGADNIGSAPCPDCARGFRIEFKIGVKRDARGEIKDAWDMDPRSGPWGPDGYWQGREKPPLTEQIVQPSVRNVPPWVTRWQRARRAGDSRLFPEQADGIRDLHLNHGYPLGAEIKKPGCPSGYEDAYLIVETKPTTDREHWVQADEYVT